MTIQEQILQLAREKDTFKTIDVYRLLEERVTRQYVSSIVSTMVKRGLLVKSGSTAKARYALPKNADKLETTIVRHLLRTATKEHEVLDAINHNAPFLTNLDENIRNLLDYSFSEMLNNALEHSESKYVDIEIGIDATSLHFTVADRGIGVFRNVMKERGLQSEFEAMQDLLKGKTTTQPHAHSGEGIFFTSKVADMFVLESAGFLMRIDNTISDIFFEETRPVKKGTRVHFTIALQTKKHLTDVFSRYETDHDDPDFDKTEIQVRLYKVGTIYVSRSQARRIVAGLDKFKHVVFDFDQVSTVGQAFADEIFRVFQNQNPHVVISSVNMNEAVKYMIDRVDKPTSFTPQSTS